jgi:hypothetical protein
MVNAKRGLPEKAMEAKHGDGLSGEQEGDR